MSNHNVRRANEAFYAAYVKHGAGSFADLSRRAWMTPQAQEVPVGGMLRGWLLYADQHEQRFASLIGHDYVLGPAWAAIGRALIELLNGETGHFDGGTLDALIRDTLAANDMEIELGIPNEPRAD